MKSYDYINDVHLDFWVRMDSNQRKFQMKTIDFANRLIPENPSKTLVIGGDLGHYNQQNYWFLEELCKTYLHILIVFGNHDYYLISQKQKKKYDSNSYKRTEEMKYLVKELPVTYLEGNVIEFDGITFGGTGMWYDFQYGQKTHKQTKDEVFLDWAANSNDYKAIKGLITLEHFEKEKDRLEKVINKSDVIVSHVGPHWRWSPYIGDDQVHNSYYFFDGSEYEELIKNKTWCFGHVHISLDMEHKGGRYISYGLGYPSESDFKKFKTIMI